MNTKSSSLKTFLSLSVGTFLVLLLVNLGLPALFLLLRIPSFAIGNDPFWLLRWENTADRSGIQFNVLLLLMIAIAALLVHIAVIRVNADNQ